MLESLRFHHIGVAVFDIEATASVYEAGGYRRTATIFDPVQNVDICWLRKEGSPTVELLAPVNGDSPVNKTLEKVGVSPYHCCYVTDDLDNAIQSLRRQRYVVVSKPVPAVAISGCRVAFLFNKNVGLIELVESPATITE